MKSKMRNRILALLLVVAMVMNGGVSALASGAAPTANEETGHVHTDECYTEEKTVTCGQEEIQGHTHGEGCYTTTLNCGSEEFAGHTHDDNCYQTTVSSCGKEEHSHSQECNTEEPTCGKEEHTHDDGCNKEVKELVCIQEESEGHTHGDGCKTTELTCSQEEVAGHIHTEECYTTTKTLTCTIPTATAAEKPVKKTTCEVCGLEECTCEKEVVVCEVCGLEECTCEKEVVVCEVCGLEECTCEKEVVVCEVCGLEECTCEKETTGCICGNEACECENCEEGCTCTSVEEFVESVEFEDEDIKVTVTAVDENAIPANVTLKVLPIVAGDEETEVQYAEVEKQLQEEVEDEETDILGFVAYDITFVDEEGIEVEPKGQVQVFMEYKKAIAPENVDYVEDADVTVMHFEEDENGEVAQVVDMDKEDQLNAIETTDANEVTKAEFETESFSVFTIVWTAESEILKAYCVDMSGDHIGEEEFEISKQDITASATEISVGDLQKDLTTYNYAFSEFAYVAETPILNLVSLSSVDESKQVEKVRYYDSKWQYDSIGSNDEWTDFGSNKLFFVYNVISNKVAKVPTVNSRDRGINISLFNYTGQTNSSHKNGFYFWAGGNGIDTVQTVNNTAIGTESGKYTNAHEQYARQNMVCYNLSGGATGYPVLNENYKGGSGDNADPAVDNQENVTTQRSNNTLEYLFSSGTQGVSAYTNLSGLFQQDSDGYYYFNSKNNHAQYNDTTQNIDVYNAKMRHQHDSSTTGQFIPFDNIENASSDNGGVYRSENKRAVNETTFRYGDLWLGMRINASFYQPKDGLVNSNPMVFYFSGDDDVWTFIDGVKVLDIGGIHGATNGTINFATGDVVVNTKNEAGNSVTLTTSIYECFEKAYKELNPSASDAEVNAYLEGKFVQYREGTTESPIRYRFRNYTSHTMDFFYLERGSGASNCELRFNLPVLSSDSVTVQKEIKNFEEGKFNDVEFTFKIYQGTEGQSKAEFTSMNDAEYTLRDASGNKTTMRTDAQDGTFKLKHNEQATFAGLTQGTRYYVEEVGVKTAEYDKVYVNENDITDSNNVNIGDSTAKNYQSGILVVGDDVFVNFENECTVENLNQLVIKKVVDEELISKISSENQDEYKIKVWIADQPYTGKYELITYNADGTENSQEMPDAVVGGIIKLKHNQGAKILGYNVDGTFGFPSGTSFKVEELTTSVVNTDNYASPVYKVLENTVVGYNTVSGFERDDGCATGSLKFDKNTDAVVTITNKWKYGDVAIEKQLPTYNLTFKGATFVYDVNATFKGLTLLNDVVSITFNNEVGAKVVRTDGTVHDLQAVAEQFPVGTVVKVKEVYCGVGYELKNPELAMQSKIIETATAKFSFENVYVEGRINSGSAVVNTFKKEENSWDYTAAAKDQAMIPSTSTTGGKTIPSGKDDEKESGTES